MKAYVRYDVSLVLLARFQLRLVFPHESVSTDIYTKHLLHPTSVNKSEKTFKHSCSITILKAKSITVKECPLFPSFFLLPTQFSHFSFHCAKGTQYGRRLLTAYLPHPSLSPIFVFLSLPPPPLIRSPSAKASEDRGRDRFQMPKPELAFLDKSRPIRWSEQTARRPVYPDTKYTFSNIPKKGSFTLWYT